MQKDWTASIRAQLPLPVTHSSFQNKRRPSIHGLVEAGKRGSSTTVVREDHFPECGACCLIAFFLTR